MSRFLPPILKSQSCSIDSHNLQHSTEPDGRQLYTYTVTWHDLEPFKQLNVAQTEELVLPAARPSFSFLRISPKKELTPEELQICKRLAPCNTPRLQIRECRCDGPCGKIKPVQEMRVMGLCDHYICRECYKNAPAVENANGFGCPNERCYQADLASLSTDRQRRHPKIKEVNTSKSPSALDKDELIVPYMMKSRPCLHLVDVRLTTFIPQRDSNKVCRHQQIVEMYDNYTMSQAITVLREYARLNGSDVTNRTYYCPSGRINDRTTWIRIQKEDLSIPLTKFGQEDQRIDIIFDCAAY